MPGEGAASAGAAEATGSDTAQPAVPGKDTA